MRPDAKRVLVVDDDRDVREFVCQVLEDSGYAVDFAWDGQEALAKIRAARPDLIVLDLMMPVMDGWAVLAHLKRESAFPRVVILSAFADCPRALQQGAVGCLSKPFHVRELIDTCGRALAA